MDASPVESSIGNTTRTRSESESGSIDYSFLTAYDTQTILSAILKILVEKSKVSSLSIARDDFVSRLKKELANKTRGTD